MRKIVITKKAIEEVVRKLKPMRVRQICQFSSTCSYPVCPACQIAMEREYQSYCDRCGQRLDWKHFENATVIWGATGHVRSTAFDGKKEDDDAEESEDAW